MALRNQPYLPLYVQDFLTDEKLAECSASATGVYIRLMCLMHKSSFYGKILLKQKYKQTDEQILNFASMVGKNLLYDLQTVVDGLSELVSEGVLQIEGDFLVQKRMVKDNEISEKRATAGKNGGKKTQKNVKDSIVANSGFASDFAKANIKANTENEYEIENEDEGVLKGVVGEKQKNPEQFPNSNTELNLSESEIGSCIEFCRLTSKLIWKPPEVLDKFNAFRIQNFTGSNFYESRTSIIKHFREWLKLQKQQANGKINGHSPKPDSSKVHPETIKW